MSPSEQRNRKSVLKRSGLVLVSMVGRVQEDITSFTVYLAKTLKCLASSEVIRDSSPKNISESPTKTSITTSTKQAFIC